MIVAITGVTGFIGRNLLCELIKRHSADLAQLQIFLFGRGQGEVSFRDRVLRTLLTEGAEYCDISPDSPMLKAFIDKGLHCIEFDLSKKGLGISREDLLTLRTVRFDFVFHSAASTDLRTSAAIQHQIEKTNIQGTELLLALVKELKVDEFCYVSTAYANGKTYGRIDPDYVNFEHEFRNPYEFAKLKAETVVEAACKAGGIRCRIFRPSSVCGRLMEKPLGAINKFDVFYGWGAFFLALKLKHLGGADKVFDVSVPFNARIFSHPRGGLNIVPVDYVVKAMYHICTEHVAGTRFHLVSPKESQHRFYLDRMIAALNITGIKHVDYVPTDKNDLENFYYRTVGKIFTPYVDGEPILFDTSNYDHVMKKAGIVCPPIDQKNFDLLMDFAKKQFFGMTAAA
ncbi:MAG: SDR family oxidoreductase [Candidatus Omnitrophica bacterium]|nr:SDR family oxidoreductase [Candidatus Omnitrophota bacterium]